MVNISNNELDAKIHHLNSVGDMYLMIVPENVFFRFPVNEETLEAVACIYRVEDKGGSAASEIVSVIKNNFVCFEASNTSAIDVRIGIVFKHSEQTIGGLYINDWRGTREVDGICGDLRPRFSAKTCGLIRLLVPHPGIVLVNSNNKICA